MKYIFELIFVILLCSVVITWLFDETSKSRKMINIDGSDHIVEDVIKLDHELGVKIIPDTNIFTYIDHPTRYLVIVRKDAESDTKTIEVDRKLFMELQNKIRNITGFSRSK